MKDAVLIVRHDGTDAIRVKEEKPWYKSGDAHVLRCTALHGSDETGVGTLTVNVSDTAVRVHKIKFPQHPSYSASYMLDVIAECQIGEYLDGLSGRFAAVKETPSSNAPPNTLRES